MKKIYSLLFASGLVISSQAQLAKKYAYFEHFTQASCGPCAAQNPTFDANVLSYYTSGVHHVAFHTSWPGVDPMNAQNKPQVQSRVTYYAVNGVPNMQMNGSDKGSPANVSRAMVDAILAQGSPVKVDVTSTVVGTDLQIKVTVTTVGDKPAGTYKLMTAAVEKVVNYTTAPGSNGEKKFPNVFRKMATADNGDVLALAEKGQSVEFNYTVPMAGDWKPENMIAVAAIQGSDKDILNSGSSLDVATPITYGLLGDPSKAVALGVAATPGTFTVNVKNTGSSAENFKLNFLSDAPNDWTSSIVINGTTITTTGEATVNIPGNTAYDAVITVTPGSTPYVGSYTLSLESADNAGTIKFTKNVKVIHGVRDLVISHTEAASGKMPKDFESIYMNGINNAGNSVHAASDSKFLVDAFKAGILTDVKSVYYNVGFSQGALSDEMITELKKFIDNGGNLFLAGQDLGWEYCDQASGIHYSANAVAFFKNYLHTGYVADNAATTNYIADNAEYFASVGTATINNTFYGTAANTYFPDQLKSELGGISIFKYNASKIGGIRYADNVKKAKTVFLGIGPEQLNDNAKKEEILKLSHDYFYSSVGIKTNSGVSANVLGDAFPNPAKDRINFTFDGLNNDMTLNIVDVTGKVVFSQEVWSGMTQTSVNTENFNSGLYFYQLVDGNNVVATKKLTIAK